ncbi:shikimate kinase domain protein [Lactobacillus delbrueckii subsp. jakobsenii ZN7a-9 = DSM 26046]|nr:shikimate kinase domain protein [Lactobacillus delbrueckii subsp. jakobsenii ZN7a-9 = DSM 26046]
MVFIFRLERVDKMRIVLVGFMACGKTTVGDLLAKKLNKLQIDLDQAIVEREKLTIPEIFAKFGEDHFRLCEHRALLANIGKDAVITTGTGICAMSWNGPQPGKLPCGLLWAISSSSFCGSWISTWWLMWRKSGQ